jgi:hypothetical protein
VTWQRRDAAREVVEAAAAHTLLEAAGVMTRTVEEQVDALRSTTVLLERATGQAEEAAEAYLEAQGETGLFAPSPVLPATNGAALRAPSGSPQPRTYAAAAGVATPVTTPRTRACAVSGVSQGSTARD